MFMKTETGEKNMIQRPKGQLYFHSQGKENLLFRKVNVLFQKVETKPIMNLWKSLKNLLSLN